MAAAAAAGAMNARLGAEAAAGGTRDPVGLGASSLDGDAFAPGAHRRFPASDPWQLRSAVTYRTRFTRAAPLEA